MSDQKPTPAPAAPATDIPRGPSDAQILDAYKRDYNAMMAAEDAIADARRGIDKKLELLVGMYRKRIAELEAKVAELEKAARTTAPKPPKGNK